MYRGMKSILRILRGALGTAVTWAVSWAAGGPVLAIIFAIGTPGIDFATVISWVLTLTGLGGLSGLLGGTAFSIALGSIHRRRKLGELSSGRMGIWGALAGLMVPFGIVTIGIGPGGFVLPLDALVTAILFFAGGGAATAVVTVKVAQAADLQIGGQRFKGALPCNE